jgi:hypothetical protein
VEKARRRKETEREVEERRRRIGREAREGEGRKW